MKVKAMRKFHCRNGFTLVELQVAFVVFAIAMAGLCPLVVMQSKHLRNIEARFSDDTTYYLIPSTDEWARKLGAAASIETTDPGAPAADPILVVDDGDSAFSTVGTGWSSNSGTGLFQGDGHLHAAGTAADIAKWQFTGLTPGWYDVRVTWLKKNNQATDAPFTVFDGSDSEGTFNINQKQVPSGDTYSGQTWESLGVFLITSGDVLVELSADANGKVVADGVRLVQVVNDVQINSLEKSLTSENTTAHVSVTVLVP